MATIASPEVLVIEADTAVRQMMQTLLEGEGFKVHLADSGQTALQILAGMQVLPAAVIIEQSVPVMTAPQFLQALRSYTRFLNLPVIVCTGPAMGDPRNRSCVPYVPRPGPGGALLGVLRLVTNFAKGTNP